MTRTGTQHSVLAEILSWSEKLPTWQRDCLRRLVATDEVDGDSIAELALILKTHYGVAGADEEEIQAVPLESKHLPTLAADDQSVVLLSLTHHRGVNALAEEQTLTFGNQLTVIFGANAAGKSGYTRILKRACRARGAEDILGNVLDSTPAPSPPSATIKYRVGTSDDEFEWTDAELDHEVLGKVSVFDSHCATVYLAKETDVAFRPLGLDLFDQLSNCCEAVSSILKREKRILEDNSPQLPELPPNTDASRLVENITSMTKTKALQNSGTLSEDEHQTLKESRKRLRDLESANPGKSAKTLQLRAGSLRKLSTHLKDCRKVLVGSARNELETSLDRLQKAKNLVSALEQSAFPPDLLDGSGGSLWIALWEAARHFSEAKAYPDHEFPHTDEKARCLLCQQFLDDQARHRFKSFEEHVKSTAQQELAAARSESKSLITTIKDLEPTNENTERYIEDLGIEDETLATVVQGCLGSLDGLRTDIVLAIQEGNSFPKINGAQVDPTGKVEAEAARLDSRAKSLLADIDPENRAALEKATKELGARELLGKNIDLYLGEIERKKKIAAYDQCIKETNTRDITRKSTELTKAVVTDQLTESFKEELDEIGFRKIEVELEATGGKRGALFHKLRLIRAPSTSLSKVVSEGEARAIAIAAFFAELTTASTCSPILFDDPVSSLDHEWRDNVACRLADKATKHQVIVFTHDIVFAIALREESKKRHVDCLTQYVRNENIGPGVAAPDLPWIGMRLNRRIGYLHKLHQEAAKTFREEGVASYEPKAAYIYGKLREAWERAVEEVLIGGVIERYRKSVETQRMRSLATITEDDCRAIERGMSKCSRWLPGHDQAVAENVSMPEPQVLLKDIQALDEWVKQFRSRA